MLPTHALCRMLEVSLSSSISSSSSNGIFSLLPSAWPVLLLDGTCTLDEPLKVIARRKPQKLPGHLVSVWTIVMDMGCNSCRVTAS